MAPVTEEEFFNSCLGKTFRHIPGHPGKFAELMPWITLNQILCHSRLDYPRLRLVRDGALIAPETWLSYTESKYVPRHFNTRLQTAAVTEHLRQGASLVLEGVEELYEPINDLACEMQRVFRERIQVNLYASWYTSQGFDLHWDDHDVIVLQVAGRKVWKVYGPARPFPLRKDIAPNTQPPEKPLWEGLLEDGDLLYIPRGWWHVVVPVDEPVLHLTFGIYHSTGLDLAHWLADQLRASETFRRDLPRFAGQAELKAHADRLRDELLVAWDDDLISRFLASRDSVAGFRQTMNLPWGAMPDPLPPSDTVRVCLTTVRPLDLRTSSGQNTVEFHVGGRKWKFPASVAIIFQMLEEQRTCSVGALCAAAAERFSREAVRGLLSQLLVKGLIALADIPEIPERAAAG